MGLMDRLQAARQIRGDGSERTVDLTAAEMVGETPPKPRLDWGRPSRCPECNGRGVISFGQGSFAVNRTCPVCLGRGQVPTEPCPTCHGTGEVRVKRKVLINVPAGVDTGSKIRLKGQGGKGPQGGPAGDLIITFNVLPDKFYRRDGLDVIASRIPALLDRYRANPTGAKQAALLSLLAQNPAEKKIVFVHHRDSMAHRSTLRSSRA